MMAALAGKDVSFELNNSIAGTPTNLLVHYLPDRDENGMISGIFGMLIDRTESHRAQALLKASERQLRAVTDNLPVFITYIDAQE
jgi:PAS domain-containing protein